MKDQITIFHDRPAVGETVAWSLGFATGYESLYVNNGMELQTIALTTSVVLTDLPNLMIISKSDHLFNCPMILLIDDIGNINALSNIDARVTGVIDLSNGPQNLVEKVQQVLEKRSDDQHILLQQLINQKKGSTKKEDNDYHLTVKEKQILKQLREGVHLKMIAHNTGTSYETVRTHMKHIYRKLGVMSVSEAMIMAMKIDLE